MTAHRSEFLLAGCGAIGSRVEAALGCAATLTCIDNQRVEPDNLGIAAFADTDVGDGKAAALAARHRARGAVGRSLCGDLRYVLRPGLARALDTAVICLDNPSAIRDAAEVLWTVGAPALPVLVLTCGSEARSYQARLFVAPGLCPICLWGTTERHADALARTASCVDTTAPRAAAGAAQAAADTGAAMLSRWQAGDRTLANCRVQRDAGGPEYVVRMPDGPAAGCSIAHRPVSDDCRSIDLGGSITTLTVGALAQAAIRHAGRDAEILLGRRALPLAGLYCPHCRVREPAAPLLLPAAVRRWQGCACGAAPRSLGERNRVSAETLLADDVATLTLAGWGAGHGDEFIATGRSGQVRLRCAFAWEDIDGN